MMRHGPFLLAVLLVLASCATPPTPAERTASADRLAAQRGWHAERLQAGRFTLLAYAPNRARQDQTLTVYLEGDGFAWYSPDQPSSDPTPIDPVGLKLALAQPEGEAVYLGRPCQYVTSPGCAVEAWTNRRFGPEIVDAMDRAIDQLKRERQAQDLILVGYSGGGALAALVAARRHDVTRLVTVAGNLDPRGWTAYLHLSALDGSLDPVDVIDRLQGIPQWHFVGDRDTTIPPGLTTQFAAKFPSDHRPRVIVETGVDHHAGWVARWPALWRTMNANRP